MTDEWLGRTGSWVRPPIVAVTALAEEMRAQGADLIDLGQAILGLPPPRASFDAVQTYLRQPGPHSYSPDPGLPALREAIAQMLRVRKGIRNAQAAGTMVTCGANQAFANALFTITRPGDEIITFDPGYFDHGYAIRMAGCTEIPVPLAIEDGRFAFDLNAVTGAMSDKTRAVVLVSPGNPTGAVAPKAFVEGLCEACSRRGLWLLSDETYDFLTFEPAVHHSPASLGADDRVIVIGSFSKIFAMAGWRVGYLQGSASLVDEAFKVQDALVVCAPVASQQAVLAALGEMDTYLARVRPELIARRDTLLAALEGWGGVRAVSPSATTFLLARLENTDDDKRACRKILREAGVIAVPGSSFGAHGRGTIRLSFGNQPIDRLREAGERLRPVRL